MRTKKRFRIRHPKAEDSRVPVPADINLAIMFGTQEGMSPREFRIAAKKAIRKRVLDPKPSAETFWDLYCVETWGLIREVVAELDEEN